MNKLSVNSVVKKVFVHIDHSGTQEIIFDLRREKPVGMSLQKFVDSFFWDTIQARSENFWFLG